MPQGTFFDVTGDELSRLSSTDAVEVIRMLLLAEAAALGMPVMNVDVPLAVTVSDGGVDAEVRAAPAGGRGIIYEGLTRYQIKTGTFSLSPRKSDIEELILRPGARGKGASPSKDDINPRIRGCLEKNGTLVAVVFGSDRPDRNDDEATEGIRAYLAAIDREFATSKIVVWRQNQLRTATNAFPGIALRIKGRMDLNVQTHGEWAKSGDMSVAFLQSQSQQEFIKNLRDALTRQESASVHVRICGEPGIGKTRLVLEATRGQPLEYIVVYAGTDEALLETPAIAHLKRAATDISVLLVVDECSPDGRSQLHRTFKNFGPNVRVVSIYQDFDEADASGEYIFFDAPRMSDNEVAEIVRSYDVAAEDALFWAQQCEGSPRVAHVVGRNLRTHPDDPLQEDGLNQVWASLRCWQR